MKSLLTLCLFAMALTAQARLGETQQQLTNRYGVVKFTEPDPVFRVLGFEFGKYKVVVCLRDGLSAVETVLPKEPEADVSEQAYLAVARMIAGCTNWVQAPSAPGDKAFKSEPMGFLAFIEKAGSNQPHLSVTSSIEALRIQEERKKKHEKAAAGF